MKWRPKLLQKAASFFYVSPFPKEQFTIKEYDYLTLAVQFCTPVQVSRQNDGIEAFFRNPSNPNFRAPALSLLLKLCIFEIYMGFSNDYQPTNEEIRTQIKKIDSFKCHTILHIYQDFLETQGDPFFKRCAKEPKGRIENLHNFLDLLLVDESPLERFCCLAEIAPVLPNPFDVKPAVEPVVEIVGQIQYHSDCAICGRKLTTPSRGNLCRHPKLYDHECFSLMSKGKRIRCPVPSCNNFLHLVNLVMVDVPINQPKTLNKVIELD